MSLEDSALVSAANARAQHQLAMLQYVGSGQKLAIYSILLQLVLLLARAGLPVPQNVVLYLYCFAFVLAIFAIFLMARGLRFNSLTTFVSVLAQFIPVFNVLILFYLIIKSARVLRLAGYQVGLLGVKSTPAKP